MELRGHADTSAHRFPDIHSSADSYAHGSACGDSYPDSVGGTDGYAGVYRHSSADGDSYGCSYRGTEFNTGSHRDTICGTHIHARDVSYVDTFGYASGGHTYLYAYTGSNANTSCG